MGLTVPLKQAPSCGRSPPRRAARAGPRGREIQRGRTRNRSDVGAYRCADAAVRNRQNQLRPSSPFRPVDTWHAPAVQREPRAKVHFGRRGEPGVGSPCFLLVELKSHRGAHDSGESCAEPVCVPPMNAPQINAPKAAVAARLRRNVAAASCLQAPVVLFDVEGPLVDAVPATLQCWRETLSGLGHDVAIKTLQRMSGLNGTDMLMHLLPGVAREETRRLIDSRGQRYRSRYLPEIKPFPQ